MFSVTDFSKYSKNYLGLWISDSLLVVNANGLCVNPNEPFLGLVVVGYRNIDPGDLDALILLHSPLEFSFSHHFLGVGRLVYETIVISVRNSGTAVKSSTDKSASILAASSVSSSKHSSWVALSFLLKSGRLIESLRSSIIGRSTHLATCSLSCNFSHINMFCFYAVNLVLSISVAVW